MMKLLIADDEDTIRRGISKYIKLHTDRFDKIYEAENGQEAIDIILKYQPDILLLDVQMPLKNGLDVMKEAEKAGLHPVTIILSGYDEFKYAQQAMRYGVKEYLLKPTRAEEILACLNQLADEYVAGEKKDLLLEQGGLRNPIIETAADYIAEHYAENITLAEVAEKAGISACYLSSMFSQAMECGYVDYLNRVRISHACCYLEQNYLKTYEIAYKVGFRDEKYFSKVFKKIKGMSPKEYRGLKR